MNESETRLSCIDCGTTICDKLKGEHPEFCLSTALDQETIDKVQKLYEDEENRKISIVSAKIENDFYQRYTRVEEVVEFAKKMGFKKLGIATCVGLINESRILAKILRKNGFEVFGAACKTGSFMKKDVGITPEHMTNVGSVMCNPIMQAELLNREGTELNIVMGLCVGHDSLFNKYSEALVTTLIAKDRVLAHNPVAALYQTGSYYKRLMK